jgi:hypothetical protein
MTGAQKKRKVKAMFRRWLEDEKLLDEIAQRPEPQFSDLSEVLRNLGSAIAYAQAYVNKDAAQRSPPLTSVGKINECPRPVLRNRRF